MAITHKRQDDLESMFANFASFPKVSSDPEKEKESKDKNDKKAAIHVLWLLLITYQQVSYNGLRFLSRLSLRPCLLFYLERFYLVSSRFT